MKPALFISIRLTAVVLMAFDPAAPAAYTPAGTVRHERAEQTTQIARELLLSRIEDIAGSDSCRLEFAHQNIDLNQLRRTVRQTRFYSAAGLEGKLRISQAVGRPAAPDQTLRALAFQVVLGYWDGDRYVRTKHVVLNRGYFDQSDVNGSLRLRTREEKQNLLLHELLHIPGLIPDFTN